MHDDVLLVGALLLASLSLLVSICMACKKQSGAEWSSASASGVLRVTPRPLPLIPSVSRPNSSSSNEKAVAEYTEVLIHNVSHTDMVLSLAQNEQHLQCASEEHVVEIMARPKFNYYHSISKMIDHASRGHDLDIASFPVYARAEQGSPHHLKDYQLPLGFHSSIRIKDVERLRFRRENRNKLPDNSASIIGVYFPLLSVLMPKWKQMITENGKDVSRKIVFLVTGVGTPRSDEHKLTDNSTEAVAALMTRYLLKAYPEVHEVKHVHSHTNIFRYDENIWFVKNELLPQIDGIRNKLAAQCGSKWREMLHVTISFADGSPARISAINASLRSYTPSYMHFWQLKTFWHESKVCEDDVEMHSFQEIDTVPAVPVHHVEARARIVVNAMLKFKEEFETIIGSGVENDISSFWLRKTKKPVLAVLLVQKPGSNCYKLYRGTNMEVSMPTGSLCAERNTIGTALGADVSLRRQDLRIIAVLSLTLSLENDVLQLAKQSSNSGPATRLIPMLQEQTTKLHIEGKDRSRSLTGLANMDKQEEIAASLNEDSDAQFPEHTTDSAATGKMLRPQTSPAVIIQGQYPTLERTSSAPPSPASAARVTRLRSFSVSRGRNKRKPLHRAVHTINVVETDMNPMKPCGACNEWLKKIAEVNPDFTVVTFTDANCTGVYIEQISLM